MQAVVKTHHIRIEADKIPEELIKFLQEKYGDVEVIEDLDEELIEVTKSDWYKSIKKQLLPGESIRIYREIHGLTQADLGVKLGGIQRQNISNMESGSRKVSKKMARKLAEIFDVSIEKFIL